MISLRISTFYMESNKRLLWAPCVVGGSWGNYHNSCYHQPKVRKSHLPNYNTQLLQYNNLLTFSWRNLFFPALLLEARSKNESFYQTNVEQSCWIIKRSRSAFLTLGGQMRLSQTFCIHIKLKSGPRTTAQQPTPLVKKKLIKIFPNKFSSKYHFWNYNFWVHNLHYWKTER